MKNRIFTTIALAAALMGCARENEMVPSVQEEGVKFVITASLDDPATRMSYTENEDGGLTAAFTSSDFIQALFLNDAGEVLLSSKLPVDSYSIADDGRSARFEVSYIEIPSAATKVEAYLTHNNSGVNFTSDTVSVSFAAQNDFNAATGLNVRYSSAAVADIKTDANGVAAANMKFAYKTSMLRFKLTFPEGAPTLETGSATEITLMSQSGAVHNSVTLKGGELVSSLSETGPVVIYPYQVDTLARVAVAVATLWSGDNIKDLQLSCKLGDYTYASTLDLTRETLEAGKIYNVTRTLTDAPEPQDIWVNDEAGTVEYGQSGGENVTSDWLSCTDGVISWTANTTGSPRTATLIFKNGGSYTVTQVAPQDFRGEWTVKCSLFDTENLYGGRNNVYEGKVTFGAPLKEETLADESSVNHTNNLGITGLYRSAIMDACVEIDYEAKNVRLGVFFDRREAQSAGGGMYCVFVPEGSTNGTWGGYNFAPNDFSDSNYAWLWITSSDINSIAYFYPADRQKVGNGTYYCCGISVISGSTAEACLASTSYSTIYQANYGTQDTGGLTFYR